MSKRDEYAAQLKQQIDETNQAIDELERKANQASDAVEKKYAEQIAKLRHEAVEVSAKLDELKSTAEENWENAVGEVERIAKVFKQSFNYLKSQL